MFTASATNIKDAPGPTDNAIEHVMFDGMISWCRIALLSIWCKIVWCQFVWSKINVVTICLVPNCPDTKLSGAILSQCHIELLPNCPVPNCPVAKLYGAKFPWYRLWLARQIFSTLFFSLIFCIFIFESALEWSKINKYPPWTWYNCTKYVCPLLGYLGLCQVLLIRWAFLA